MIGPPSPSLGDPQRVPMARQGGHRQWVIVASPRYLLVPLIVESPSHMLSQLGQYVDVALMGGDEPALHPHVPSP